MALKVTSFELSPEQIARLRDLVPERRWAVLSSTELNGVLPDRFLAKVDSVIAVASPTSSGGTCLLFNALRVDEPARLVDQEPLGLFLRSTEENSTGVLVHHGSWDDRSWKASSELWRGVAESGIGNYFLTNPPEGRHSGTLEELPRGTAGALDHVLKALRDRHRTSST
jgi:hypothetical protein